MLDNSDAVHISMKAAENCPTHMNPLYAATPYPFSRPRKPRLFKILVIELATGHRYSGAPPKPQAHHTLSKRCLRDQISK
jgi:hypothetical protein